MNPSSKAGRPAEQTLPHTLVKSTVAQAQPWQGDQGYPVDAALLMRVCQPSQQSSTFFLRYAGPMSPIRLMISNIPKSNQLLSPIGIPQLLFHLAAACKTGYKALSIESHTMSITDFSIFNKDLQTHSCHFLDASLVML